MVMMTRKRAAEPVSTAASSSSVDTATVTSATESPDHSNLQLLASSASSEVVTSIGTVLTGQMANKRDVHCDTTPTKVAKSGQGKQSPKSGQGKQSPKSTVVFSASQSVLSSATVRSLLTGAIIAKAGLQSHAVGQEHSPSSSSGSLVTSDKTEHSQNQIGKLILVNHAQNALSEPVSGVYVTQGGTLPLTLTANTVSMLSSPATKFTIVPSSGKDSTEEANFLIKAPQASPSPAKLPAVLMSPGPAPFLLASPMPSSGFAVTGRVSTQQAVAAAQLSPVPKVVYSQQAGGAVRLKTGPSGSGGPTVLSPVLSVSASPSVQQLLQNTTQCIVATPAVLEPPPTPAVGATSSASLLQLPPPAAVVSSVGSPGAGAELGSKPFISHFKRGRYVKPAERSTTSTITILPAASRPSDLCSQSSGGKNSAMASTSSSSNADCQVMEEVEMPILWDEQKTRELIQLYSEHKMLLSDPQYKKRSVWDLITNKLNQTLTSSQHFRWNQVENKWKNLTKKYRDCVDMNLRNHTAYKCSFHQEIAAVYDYNPEDDKLARANAGRRQRGEGLNLVISTPSRDGTVVVVKHERQSPTPEVVSFANKPSTEPLSSSVLLLQQPHQTETLLKKKKYARLNLTRASHSVAAQNFSNPIITTAAATTTANASTPIPRPILPWPPLPTTTITSASTTPTCPENSCSLDVAAFLHQLREDRDRQERARMERLEAMHREKMNMFTEFLNILKRVVEEK